MTEKVKRFLRQNPMIVLTLVAVTSQIASGSCQTLWFQPVEPKGLSEFTAKTKIDFEKYLEKR
jgi:cyclic lactone autoinducer peptide